VTWTRNAAGSVLAESSTITSDPTNNSRTYTYDPAGRLTGFTDGAATTAYGWAETLNRTSVQTTGGPSVPTTYDAANRPLDQNGVPGAYGSDADGRLTTRPEPDGSASQRLEWDSLGRLTRVRPPNGNSTIALYTYDPLDRLHLVDHGGADQVRFRYAGLTTTAVQTIDDQSGAVIANTDTGWGGEPLEDWTGSNSNLRVYGTNGHHDLTWTAGSTGSVSGTVRYDPWGSETSVTGSWSSYLAT
jgi:YD repeat-containing protein